jgi:hypothetical protein
MTFTEIVTEVMERLNLTSSEAETRIGRNVNVRYKRVTTAIGLQTSRRTQVQADTTLGVQTLTFTSIEKVLTVIDKSSGKDRILQEVSIEELRQGSIGTSSTPGKYAIYRMGASSVTILLDTVPQEAFTLYADGFETVSTLSGSNEPAFPESFHDILVEGAIADEYRKAEKQADAAIAESVYERRLSDVKFYIAKNNWLKTYQGKSSSASLGSGGGGGSTSTPNGAASYTQTGLITFDRDPSAPFAVSASSAKVTNLDADLLDGEEAADFHDAAQLTGALPAISGASLTNLNASNLASGTVPDARFPATLPAISGVNLTNLDASDLASGTVPTARLGSGTASVETFLRGDQSWAKAFGLVCEGRLTLTSVTPVTTADVTGATTVYFTPYKGNRIALYNGTNWQLYSFSEISLALGTLTNDLPYDVFVYDNAGTLTLEFTAWTSKTARATAITLQDGVYVKSGATTRRYLGTFHTTATTTTEDSFSKRLLWNYYNRVRRPLRFLATTNTWSYTTATWRQSNADTSHQIAAVVGVAEVSVNADLLVFARNTNTAVQMAVALKEDSVTAPAHQWVSAFGIKTTAAANEISPLFARLSSLPAVGYHFWAWLEYSDATGTTTWFGDNNGNTVGPSSGIHGSIEG